MGKSTLFLPVLLVMLTGCVVTYGNFPDASFESLSKDHEPKSLAYHINPIPVSLLVGESQPSWCDDWCRALKDSVRPLLRVLAPNWYPLGMDDFFDAGIREVPRTLETSGMFSELTSREGSGSGKGTFVEISFSVHPPAKGALTVVYGQWVICVIPPFCPFAAWGIIPYYSDEGGLTVSYDLYQDWRGPISYSYRIHKKGAGGLLLLPFAWLNFFTDDLNDALRATTLQFLIDAHRDGHL